MPYSTVLFMPDAKGMSPQLIVREEILREFSEGLDNGPGAPGRLMRIAGNPSTAMTSLLAELGSIAAKRGWTVVSETASDGFLGRLVWRLVCELGLAPALGLDLGADPGSKVSPQVGVNPGELPSDPPSDPPFGGFNAWGRTNIVRDLIRLAGERSGVLIALEDVRASSLEEVAVVAVAVQHAICEDLDVAFVLAGLPAEVDQVVNGESISFLLRAVPFDLEYFDGTVDEHSQAE